MSFPYYFLFLLLSLNLLHHGISQLEMSYYSESCPNAETIIKEEVTKLYHKHGNTAVSWIRNLFHDCMLKLGGPTITMKTGRKDSQLSYEDVINDYLPDHNDTMQTVLARFQSIGVDVEGTVALLGAHSVGRVHCMNIVDRIYPTIDPTLDPDYAEYLKRRCPDPNPDPESVEYARNDLDTPMLLDNMYYKNLLESKGLMVVDQELASDPSTLPFVEKMAVDNSYFHDQFARALILLSENNPLVGDQGEVRVDCAHLNSG